MAISALSSRAAVDLQDNRQHEMLRDMIPFVILANLAVVGRFVSRRLRRASIGADDYMIVLGLVGSTFDEAVMLYLLIERIADSGLGRLHYCANW